MKVVEKFISINGEGKRVGQLAAFIRFAGCNLDCSYCDTRWANEADVPYERMEKESIYKYIKDSGVNNVTITGGEPLLQDGAYDLLEYLSLDRELNVEIETNGSVDISHFHSIKNTPSFTLDYKLGYSQMEDQMKLRNLELLTKNDVIKFVSGSFGDLNRVKELIQEYSLTKKTNVYISPVFGAIEPREIVEWMQQHKLNGISLQLQLHKIIWEPYKKGV